MTDEKADTQDQATDTLDQQHKDVYEARCRLYIANRISELIHPKRDEDSCCLFSEHKKYESVSSFYENCNKYIKDGESDLPERYKAIITYIKIEGGL